MKSPLPLLSIFVLVNFSSLVAGPAGKGHAGGGPGEFRGVIHSLFAKHEDFARKVELLENGYRAETTSENPESAKLLQRHVAQMEERLDGGLGVRHWDPAFAELREHYEDMVVEVKSIEGGVAVSVIGKTPEAIQVALNHAKIVTGFVEKGESQMHATHAAVLATEEKSEAGHAKSGTCCQDGKGKGKGKDNAGGKACDGSCGKGEKGEAGPAKSGTCCQDGKGKGKGKGNAGGKACDGSCGKGEKGEAGAAKSGTCCQDGKGNGKGKDNAGGKACDGSCGKGEKGEAGAAKSGTCCQDGKGKGKGKGNAGGKACDGSCGKGLKKETPATSTESQ